MKRVLLPLDLFRSRCDSLLYLRELAAETPLAVTLLHVVELNIAPPPPRLYQQLCAEAEGALRMLARHFFGHEQAARVCVRVGRAYEEIVAEARASRSELIILSGFKPRGWRSWLRPSTVARVVPSAPCPTLVLPLATKTDSPESLPVIHPRRSPAPLPTIFDKAA